MENLAVKFYNSLIHNPWWDICQHIIIEEFRYADLCHLSERQLLNKSIYFPGLIGAFIFFSEASMILEVIYKHYMLCYSHWCCEVLSPFFIGGNWGSEEWDHFPSHIAKKWQRQDSTLDLFLKPVLPPWAHSISAASTQYATKPHPAV